MNPVRFSFVVLTLLLIPASLALAGGFQLNEVGARAMGMGGAFTAKANDLTAIYFNPAGLAYQKGFGAYLGGTMILPSNSYTTPSGSSTTDMVSQTFLLPNGYVGYGMENGLAFGLGVFVPYGLGTEWPAGWVGRTEAMKSDIQTIMINPTVAYRVSDQFMIGGGVTWTTSTVKLSYDIQTGATSYGSVALEADGNAFSFDLGAIYKPIPKFSIGVAYRHTTDLDLEGTAVFSNMGGLAPYFPGGTGKTNIVLPNTIFAGVAYDVNENLTLSFDYHWVGWSTYDSLNLDLPYGPTFPLSGRPLQGPSRSEKAWKDTYLLRVGGEYRHKEWSFRLGFVYDANPQPARYVEPTLPDANRVEGTLGIGYKFSKNWFVDAAFQFISFSDRTVTGPPPTGDLNEFPGTYKASANLIGLSIGYSM
jgi:long-chain fatty acid transport protein